MAWELLVKISQVWNWKAKISQLKYHTDCFLTKLTGTAHITCMLSGTLSGRQFHAGHQITRHSIKVLSVFWWAEERHEQHNCLPDNPSIAESADVKAIQGVRWHNIDYLLHQWCNNIDCCAEWDVALFHHSTRSLPTSTTLGHQGAQCGEVKHH